AKLMVSRGVQLIKARGKEVTEPVVRAATAGMKEADTSQTAVLNDLFAPLSRKRVKDLGLTEDEEGRYAARLSREIEASGAMDKVAQGCFEHYASCHRHDANFGRYLKAHEWLGAYDVLAGEMRAEREYALLAYLPHLLAAFFPLFQERGGGRVERAKADYENYLVTRANEEIYAALARGLRGAGGGYRHLAGDAVLRLEVAPLLMRIVSPPLKPVNRQIIRPGERAVLGRVVDIMVALELRFVQEKMEDGQLTYRLDPPIDVFVTYDGKRAVDIAVSKYAVRQLVATEIDARLVSVQTETGDKGRPGKEGFFRQGASSRGAKAAAKHPGEDGEPQAKRARGDGGVPAVKVAVDFFGRPIVPKADADKTSQEKVKEAEAKKTAAYRVAYRFNEGNSAAVRKPVKVAAFL
ncbi:hypothetical protein POSPLADRAFT_1135752, partial [Postia placenta MAD-698-R-SB12]